LISSFHDPRVEKNMTAAEMVDQLKSLGLESYKNTIKKHGIPEPLFGVKIEELKKIQKRIKKDYRLALDLYDTGIYDAMYLAGLIADDKKMTKKDLKHWVEQATCKALLQYTIAWVAAGSDHGYELALEWIDSKKENFALSGWSMLGGLVSITPDEELDLGELKKLLDRVKNTIHKEPDAVRYVMNGFVIAVGSYVKDLTQAAILVGQEIGKVTVDMGDTACKVPFSPDYIQKVVTRGAVGKKRATVKC